MNPPSTDPADRDEMPGVPGFHNWRVVYFFVLGFFALCVGLLALFTHVFA